MESSVTLIQQTALEQAVVDAFYAKVDADAQHEAALAAESRQALERDASAQERFERDAAEARYQQTLEHLATLDDFLVIGRLDLAPGSLSGDADDPGTIYVGRAGVDLNDGRPLVDWRAPAAERWFTATAADSKGVVRRRALTVIGGRVRAVRDELLDVGAVERGDIDLATVVESDTADLLRAVVDAGSSRMKGVLATLSAEQHGALHAPDSRLLLLLGGPGTGKTAVAQHRVALMAFRRRQAGLRARVAAVSPGTRLAEQAEALLPFLGERDITTEVLADDSATLPSRRDVNTLTTPDAVRHAVRNALHRLRPRIEEPLRVVLGGKVLALPADRLARLRRQVVESTGSATQAADLYGPWVAEHLTREWVAASKDAHEPYSARRRDLVFLALSREERVVAHAARYCPVVDTGAVMAQLAGGSAGPGIGTAWSLTVTGLRDEVASVLTGTVNGEPADADGCDLVLVDEAQELTALHWRMLARRHPRARWVVAGDWRQTDVRSQADSTREMLRALGMRPSDVVTRTLTVNFRNAVEVADTAADLCARFAPDRAPLPGVWDAGTKGEHLTVRADDPAPLRALVTRLLGVEREGGRRELGVVVPVSRRAFAARALAGLEGASVVTVREVKGAEFDEVVLVAPEALAQEGASQLLVAATRASRVLHVVEDAR